MNKPIRDWTAHPPFLVPDYRSTQLRAPTHPLIPIAPGLSERTGPIYTSADVGKLDADMTKNGAHDGVPLGERIVVAGTVHDDRGRPVPNTVIELWQANAAGRYIDNADNHDAPTDPNFFG
ncbi:MAG: protocatechuate 3,4-dioxygenase subunit beta, partial [Gammaproteobacteria bacterium]|nr:protocatechuate 3,4-dioxygenase subunit beta [Gammaproteobacteria bacterium]